ncbi:MAG: class I SAM-dependent methyltransferase [Thermoplasmatota archaeon]
MGDEEKQWYEQEEFWKKYPVQKEGTKEIEDIIELLDLNPSMDVLDLCCGYGRHSIELAKRGFNVTGVDLTEHYLEHAKKRAEEEDLDIEFVHDDMREFKRDEEFDVTLNLFTSFGYFEDESENVKVLENVYESLKPHGKFVLDVMGKEIIARIFKEKDWKETEDGFVLMERSVERDWTWLKNRRIEIKDGDKTEIEFSHWLYTAKELKEMLEEVGFESVESYGSYDGKPYNENAERLVVIAMK